MSLVLKSLFCHRQYAGAVSGTVTFDGTGGSIELNLSKEQCANVLAVCSEALLAVAGEAAKALLIEVKK